MKYPAHKIPILETVCDSTDFDSENTVSSSNSDYSTESWTSFDEEDDDSYELSFIDDDTSVCTCDSICTNEKSDISAEGSFSAMVRQEQESYKLSKDIMEKILETDTVCSNKT